MSGGHYDYVQYQIERGLSDFARDPEIKSNMLELSKVLGSLSYVLGDILHDIDWWLSGDSEIDDFDYFQKMSITRLKNCFMDNSIDTLDKEKIIHSLKKELDVIKKMREKEGLDTYQRIRIEDKESWVEKAIKEVEEPFDPFSEIDN